MKGSRDGKQMYEKEILEELKKLNEKMGRIEELLCCNKGYGGEDFRGCLMRIMFNTDE